MRQQREKTACDGNNKAALSSAPAPCLLQKFACVFVMSLKQAIFFNYPVLLLKALKQEKEAKEVAVDVVISSIVFLITYCALQKMQILLEEKQGNRALGIPKPR